jgi:hypothetical protein
MSEKTIFPVGTIPGDPGFDDGKDELSMDTEQALENRLGPAWKNTETGVFVRAKNSDGRWDSVDIAYLDKSSLLSWLRSRGGNNPWAENVVGILLGHASLTTGPAVFSRVVSAEEK